MKLQANPSLLPVRSMNSSHQGDEHSVDASFELKFREIRAGGGCSGGESEASLFGSPKAKNHTNNHAKNPMEIA